MAGVLSLFHDQKIHREEQPVRYVHFYTQLSADLYSSDTLHLSESKQEEM